jgi:light-regulated signal transduction histidine kinase (bacteriophytochrome)
MKAVRQEAGQIRLQPRQSFVAWTEEVRFRSAPWTSSNLATAVESRELMLELTIGERDSLERQNIQLVRSNQELETFIYVASHDIKEPLRQMEMLADLLRNCAPVGATAEADDYLVDFRRLGKRLRNLTDELADYAKLSRSESEFLPVDLGEVVEEVVALLKDRIDRVGGEVVVGSLPTVNGERVQLHQVFLNLVGNSLKYRDPSRPLRIVISEDIRQGNENVVGLAEKSAQVRVEVKDNGIGFDPKYSERVFDAFMRIHSKDRFEGSGLGLAICRRIAERHGGRLEAMAEPNVGASFTLILPRVLPHS